MRKPVARIEGTLFFETPDAIVSWSRHGDTFVYRIPDETLSDFGVFENQLYFLSEDNAGQTTLDRITPGEAGIEDVSTPNGMPDVEGISIEGPRYGITIAGYLEFNEPEDPSTSMTAHIHPGGDWVMPL